MTKQKKFSRAVPRNIMLASAISTVIGAGNAVAEINPRIVGGSPAAENAYPFMVGLLESTTKNTSRAQFCGGSLIAPDWVLTAAHCVEGSAADEIDILVNTNKLNGSGTRIRATKIISHPDYARSEKSDMALIQLSKNADAAAISMLQTGTGLESSGHMATVIGWGLTKNGGSPSNKLLEVDVPIVSDTACKIAYSGQVDAQTEICAGFPQGAKDSCNGDSGGPLFVKDDSGSVFQAGVVSWGEGCAVAGKYGVYARVSSHISWIQNVMNGGTPPPTEPPVPGEPLELDFSFQCTGLTCAFNANVQGDSTGIEEYIWEFGDTTGWDFGQSIEYQYEQPGSYEVFLTAITRGGDYIEINKTISVLDDAQKDLFDLGEQTLSEGKFYASGSALLEFGDKLVIKMQGPNGADYDLYLEKLEQSGKWVKVKARVSVNKKETLRLKIRQAGEYRIRVLAYRGAGDFGLTVELK